VGVQWGYGGEQAVGDAVPLIPPETAENRRSPRKPLPTQHFRRRTPPSRRSGPPALNRSNRAAQAVHPAPEPPFQQKAASDEKTAGPDQKTAPPDQQENCTRAERSWKAPMAWDTGSTPRLSGAVSMTC
jgi:hypothetical protein